MHRLGPCEWLCEPTGVTKKLHFVHASQALLHILLLGIISREHRSQNEIITQKINTQYIPKTTILNNPSNT